MGNACSGGGGGGKTKAQLEAELAAVRRQVAATEEGVPQARGTANHRMWPVGQKVVVTRGQYSGDQGIVLRQASSRDYPVPLGPGSYEVAALRNKPAEAVTVYKFQVHGVWSDEEWVYNEERHNFYGIQRIDAPIAKPTSSHKNAVARRAAADVRSSKGGSALLSKGINVAKKGKEIDPALLGKIWDQADTDGDGRLTPSELRPLVVGVMKAMQADIETAKKEMKSELDQAAAADPMAGMMMGMIAPMLDMAFVEVETMLKANSKTRTSWLCECFQPR